MVGWHGESLSILQDVLTVTSRIPIYCQFVSYKGFYSVVFEPQFSGSLTASSIWQEEGFRSEAKSADTVGGSVSAQKQIVGRNRERPQ